MRPDEARGVIREARRPEGWTAPGPRPLGDQGRPELQPAADEDLCLLTGDWRVFQKLRGNRWTLDDLATAWVATRAVDPARVDRTLDLGCGLGSVLMMVAWALPGARALGVEAQAVSADLCRRSLAYNGADGRVSLREGDFRDPAVLDEGPVFDLVTGTPPYFPPGSGVESERVQCAPCRFEHRGGVEDYCAVAARHLAPGAPFVVVVGQLEHDRAWAAAEAAGLAVRAVWSIVPRAGRPPRMFVFELRAAPGEALRRELVVRGADGQWTEDFRAVRRDMGIPDAPPKAR